MLDDTIRYAVAVARHGSFTAAATHVGITQSAITKRVADLEQRLGFAIFRRTARGAILTDEGHAFVDRAARLLEDFDLLMLRNRDPFFGPLRVGVCPAALESLMVKPIAELMRRYPQVRLDVTSSSFEGMTHQLRYGRVDVVLGLANLFAERTDFSSEPLVSLGARFFTRRGHPLEHQKRVTHSALAAFEFVLPSAIGQFTQTVYQIIESSGVPAATRIQTIDYFPLVKAIVSQSDAIGIVSASYAHSAAFKANFAVIDAIEPPPAGDLCCAVRAKWEVSPIVKAFIQACRATLPGTGQVAHTIGAPIRDHRSREAIRGS